MANIIYPKFYIRCLTTGGNMVAGVLKSVAVKTVSGYSYSNSHEFLSDISTGDRIAISGALATVAAGIVTTDDVRVTADNYSITFAASQPVCGALVYFVDTGSAATSPLVKYVDTSASLPLTPPPGGGPVNVTLGANGVLEMRN